jgi:calcium-dependent protein kinase
VVTEAAKDMISQMLVMDITKRATAKQLLQHRWFQVAATAPAAALGAHMVKRLRAFAGMSRMKRLALVVLARTLTDNDVKRLRVRPAIRSVWTRSCCQHTRCHV